MDEIYRHGDQVRFYQDESALVVQVDLPGVSKDELHVTSDSDRREVYIKAKRSVKTKDGIKEQTYNRSFSVGKELDLNSLELSYVDGLLEVSVPKRHKEEYIKTHTLE